VLRSHRIGNFGESFTCLYQSGAHFEEGQFMRMGLGQIHSMYNPNTEPLISFHLYTPPLRNTRTYERK
jgi:mannose-6-phosphate isomerase-like protein (cupin superfamily)